MAIVDIDKRVIGKPKKLNTDATYFVNNELFINLSKSFPFSIKLNIGIIIDKPIASQSTVSVANRKTINNWLGLTTFIFLRKVQCPIKNKNSLVPFLKKNDNPAMRRQDIEQLYFLDGSIYISKIKTLMKYKTFYHNKTKAYEVPKWKSLEIDDIEDLNLAKFYVTNKKITL